MTQIKIQKFGSHNRLVSTLDTANVALMQIYTKQLALRYTARKA